MKILVTAFDPFGGESLNPAQLAVEKLPDVIGGHTIVKMIVPTVFGVSGDLVTAKMDEIRPDAVVCIGQAGTRSAVTPERIGINLRHARIADNAGFMPIEETIVANAPAAYFATVPVRHMVSAIEAAGLPAAASCTAGTFVCNETLYLLLHHYADTDVQVGFIHVPWLPEQGTPSLPLAQTAAALEAAIGAIYQPAPPFYI